MAAADTAAAGTWAGEDKRRMLHVVYRVGDMQVRCVRAVIVCLCVTKGATQGC